MCTVLQRVFLKAEAASLKVRFTKILLLQIITKISLLFEHVKNDFLKAALITLLANDLLAIKKIHTLPELIVTLFGLMVLEDVLRKNPCFCPEPILALEQVLLYFRRKFDSGEIDINEKDFNPANKVVVGANFLAFFDKGIQDVNL